MCSLSATIWTVKKFERVVGEAVEHGRYRAEDLARELGLADGPAELVGPTVNILPGTAGLPFGDHTAELHPEWLGPVGDLAFTFLRTPDGQGLRLHLDADAEVCDERTLRDHERRFLALLDTLAADPGRPLGRIDLTDGAERGRLLGEFGVSPREVPPLTWPAAFEDRVRRTPDAVALVFEDRRLTYAELNADANRLARSWCPAACGPRTSSPWPCPARPNSSSVSSRC